MSKRMIALDDDQAYKQLCSTHHENTLPKVEGDDMRQWSMGLAMTCFSLMAVAGQAESENAVTSILFEEDMQNASYALRANGFVDILFGPSVPDADYARILDKLKSHPDIPGVLAGKGKSDYCPVRK